MDCYDINELLASNKLYKIDFLSVDTEGSEPEIIKHIDYKTFDIFCIVCENNYDEPEVREFLASKGYNFEHRSVIDDFFVKTN